jgi:hypothetical protein
VQRLTCVNFLSSLPVPLFTPVDFSTRIPPYQEQANGVSFTDATNATAIHGYTAAGGHSAYITLMHNLNALNEVSERLPSCS